MPDIVDNVKGVRLKHAWVLGFIGIAYIAWRQPLALEPMILVASKIWLGAVIGMFIDRGLFPYARPDYHEAPVNWMYRRTAVVIAGMVGFANASF